jgi:hypothetical protein
MSTNSLAGSAAGDIGSAGVDLAGSAERAPTTGNTLQVVPLEPQWCGGGGTVGAGVFPSHHLAQHRW